MKSFTLLLLLLSSTLRLPAVESVLHPPIGMVLAHGGLNEAIELTIEEDGRYISTYDEFYCMIAEDGTIGRGGTETGHWKLVNDILRLYPESEFRSWLSGRDFSVISKLAHSDLRNVAGAQITYENYIGKFVLLDKASGILLVSDPEVIDRTRSRNSSTVPQKPKIN